MIEFYLNGEPRREAATPDTSVLELLRNHLGQCGTKEGCACGDCGACTVAIAQPEAATGDTLVYRTANACMTPAHQLQGCHLVTVEGLAQGDALYPAQSAMVDCHASQCGFCTPGIVMSLFALHEAQRAHPDRELDDHRLEAALGGNLCRCTGYRPIRDAALTMASQPDTRPPWADDATLATRLRALAATTPAESATSAPSTEVQTTADAPHDALRDTPSDTPSEAPHGTATAGRYAMPADLATLIRLLRERPAARLVAGATDLWLETTQRLQPLEDLIDVTRVAELRQLDAADDGWWIGAALTYHELEPLLATHYPAFAHLLTRLGSAQIRHRGTLGGNIANASPIGDTPPVLLALGARLRLVSTAGEREMALEDFFLDYKRTALAPGEVIASIFLPRPDADLRLRVWKLSKRREDDISTLLGVFRWRKDGDRLRDVRVAFGGMAAIPLRVPAIEATLEGQSATRDTFTHAKQALHTSLTPMTDARGSADYRLAAAANLLERWRLTLDGDADIATDAGHVIQNAMEVMLDAYAH
ncbi:xanthine dehydrogenase small subunit [Salinicola avicenniae]|uniref:xanthine dehydrogenase small subunit n=1 Tax=Salinicola avicenniae TaxID=2916836 RepID=UPI002073CF1D|nr:MULTISPECIES: xanthine dehydrogenase small subunit [unclassified Salinicola]